ncbi:MAG: hypothetical protein ACKVU1_01720 [bacterium]
MTLTRIAQRSLALALVLSAVALAPHALAQSTVFTYQGSLDDSGTPTSGLHDFRFRLFDAAAGGAQLGSTLCSDNVNVVEGAFTAQLDFGQQFATTAQRHLEIEVRGDTGLSCADATGFVVLAPRQQLTAAPIASHANSAFSLDAADGSPASAVFVDDNGNVGIGTTAPTARLDVRGGAMLVENLGDQADLLWLASERSWVFRQQGTGSGSALKLESVGGGGNKHFIVQTTGFMGVGTTAPAAKLDVRGDIKLGTSGQYQATGATETLRMLRGRVASNGSILDGAGFTVGHSSTGTYTIFFTEFFALGSTPAVTASAEWFGGAHVAMPAGATASAVTIKTVTGGGTLVDKPFYFIAVGPR